MSETKKRVNLSNYGTINAGDDTHEKVRQALRQYFGKFNRRMKIYIKQKCHVYQLPCYIFKLSFDECKQYLFHGPIFEQFQARLEEYDVMPEIAQLFKIDEFQQHIKLKVILDAQPKADTQDWDNQKIAYATLIDVVDLRSINPMEVLEGIVYEKLSKKLSVPLQINAENLNAMISEAVKITWKMVTLVPPAFIHFPEVFIEDWMEKKLSLWDQEAPDNPTVFSQPVFLYNALGQIGQKAVVGNKLSSKDMEVVNAAKEETDLANSRDHLSDKLFFYCDLCDSCIYGIERIQGHKRLCSELKDGETAIMEVYKAGSNYAQLSTKIIVFLS